MLEFDGVKKCQNIQELNEFIRKYLEERDLRGEERRSTYWALFYAWRDSLYIPF
jgi:hypothetical protein